MAQTSVSILWLLLNCVLADEHNAGLAVEDFEKQYRVAVIWQNPRFPIEVTGGSITGIAAAETVKPYLSVLVSEFSVYPKTFIQRSQLKRIVVCKDLAFAGQKRAAIPDFAGNTLYLDCERGKHSKAYQRAVMHHEFFHLVDYRDDGLVYKDSQWAALNKAGFKYGKGGAAVQQDSAQADFRNPTAGFLTNYSIAGVEEDKAELFAHLMVSYQRVEAARESDEVLDAKVARLKANLRQFCDEMDDSFWSRISVSSPR